MTVVIPQNRSGAELRYARELAALTQEAIASRLGLDRGTIRRWETQPVVSAGKAERYLRAVEELAKEDAR